MSRDIQGQVYLPGCAPEGAVEYQRVDSEREAPPGRSDQASERRRVAGEVQRAVLEFCALRLRLGAAEWRMSELTEYVRDRVICAPDSAGRILRQLDASGQLSYELVSRAESRYRILSVGVRA